MSLLVAILPTILLMAYSQLIMKWRVGVLHAQDMAALALWERLLHYLMDPYMLSAYAVSLLASFAWLYAVERYPVSLAFPVYTGVLFIVVLAGGYGLLHEPLSAGQLIGVALILSGIVLVSCATS